MAADGQEVRGSADVRAAFRWWFFTPPRSHGEGIDDRTVSFLELFYDLVYVVLIAQIAHTLAADVTWVSVGEFAVVFGLVWTAWLTGTFLHELHGREDGRGRNFIFAQMLLVAVMSIYAGHAADEDGQGFAVVYTLFLALSIWQWFAVYRADSDAYRPIVARFLTGVVAFFLVMAATIFMDPQPRVVVWAALMVASVAGNVAMMKRFSIEEMGVSVSESMVERFGLFTIIVLGEVVVGVVDGLSESDRTALTVVTGLLGLMLGFALWWSYFDFIGRRLPHAARFGTWVQVHLPLSMSIAGAGAAMVSLVEHAGDARSPASTTWLLVGSYAVMVVALAVAMLSLQDRLRYPQLYEPLGRALVTAALVGVAVGIVRPAPWLLVLVLMATLSAVWTYAFARAILVTDMFENAG